MMKMTKFLQYLESSDKFRKNLLCKVCRSIYQQKNNFISISCYIYWKLFRHFLPYLFSPNIKPNVTLYSENIVIGSNSLKNL